MLLLVYLALLFSIRALASLCAYAGNQFVRLSDLLLSTAVFHNGTIDLDASPWDDSCCVDGEIEKAVAENEAIVENEKERSSHRQSRISGGILTTTISLPAVQVLDIIGADIGFPQIINGAFGNEFRLVFPMLVSTLTQDGQSFPRVRTCP